MNNLLNKNSFADYLSGAGKIDEKGVQELVAIARRDHKSLVDVIIESKAMTETDLRDVIADYTGLKSVDAPSGVDLKTYAFLRYDVSFRYHATAISRGDLVRVAVYDPLNLEMREVFDFLARARGVNIELVVVTYTELRHLIAGFEDSLLKSKQFSIFDIEQMKSGRKVAKMGELSRGGAKTVTELEAMAEREKGASEVGVAANVDDDYSAEQKSWIKMLQEKIESIDELQSVVNTRDIPRIVAAMVHYAIFSKASDIHIEPMAHDIRVRYRVDGVLQQVLNLDKSLLPALVSRIKILALLKIDEHRIPQDGQFRVTFDNKLVDLRISTLPAVYGEKTVIRILDVSRGYAGLESLGFDGLNRVKLDRNCRRSNGMILSTGPTGSGKSTTLFSILRVVALPGVNVVTLEDPVEYHMPGVNQCQINADIGFTFARGLRSILRQDPNIIMVGEIRDRETAELAVHASLTGHLVLSTLHTNDAPSAAPRMIDMGVEPFLITSSLVLIMAQRLTRQICPKCKEEVEIPEEKKEEIRGDLKTVPKEHLEMIGLDLQDMHFYKGKGCDNCRQTGFQGRIAVCEMMEMSDEIQALVIKRVSAGDLFLQAVKEGMITMRQDGFLKAMRGMTTLDEVYRVTIK